jgi:excisionase family DNA binding protein
MNYSGDLVTTKQAAQFLGLSVGYLYKLTMRKKIPYYKPWGNRCYFKLDELRQVIEGTRISTAEENQMAALKHVLMK